MSRALAVVTVGFVAAITGTWWTTIPAIGLILLMAIREHGPTDPPPVPPLRRRQLDHVIDRQQVKP